MTLTSSKPVLFSSLLLLTLLTACLFPSSCDAAIPFLRRFTSFSRSLSSSNSNAEVDDEVADSKAAAVMRQMMMPMATMMMMSEDGDGMPSMSPMAAMDMDMMMMSPMPSSMPMMPMPDDGDEEHDDMMMMKPSMSPDMMMPDVSASPDDGDDDVCVDAAYLASKGFTSSAHFVHRNHFEADVLCPLSSGLPCGTANHAIRMGDDQLMKKTTSYKTFCAVYKCERKRMLVNSVWSHMWDENHHGVVNAQENVKLTMFDQRHPQSMQLALHRIMATARQVLG